MSSRLAARVPDNKSVFLQMHDFSRSSFPLQGKPVAKRVIVVTPSSLTQNWAAEVQKWLGSERCKALVMQPGPSAESQVNISFTCRPPFGNDRTADSSVMCA